MGKEKCELVGAFSFIVQIILGLLSFLVLIVKRYNEKPKRQWKIWVLDASKQLVSALVAHLLNVLLSIVLSSEDSEVDPCNWYFITVMFDTTLGVFLCYQILKYVEKLLSSTRFEKFKSGNYFTFITPDEEIQSQERRQRAGSDNNEKLNTNLLRPIVRVNIAVWVVQLLIWNCIVVISKTLLYFIQMLFRTACVITAEWVFSEITNKDVRLVIVMAFVPVCMNGLQFWIQDNFLKKHEFSKNEQQFLLMEMFEREDLEGFVETLHRPTSQQSQSTRSSVSTNQTETQDNNKKKQYSIQHESIIDENSDGI